jgi:hypothetical protein
MNKFKQEIEEYIREEREKIRREQYADDMNGRATHVGSGELKVFIDIERIINHESN